MNKRDLLRIIWDSYDSDYAGCTFEELFDENGMLFGDVAASIGDSLLAFILMEMDETCPIFKDDDKKTIDAALACFESIEKDVRSVREGLEAKLKELS